MVVTEPSSSPKRFEAWALEFVEGREAFVARHAKPFLVFEAIEKADNELREIGATRSFDRARVLRRRSAAELVKRSGTIQFAEYITIGRLPKNDVCLDSPSISAFHAWFHERPDGIWLLGDAKSTNGTFVSETRIEKRPVPLANGVAIGFGDGIRATFLSPSYFFDLLEMFFTKK